MSKDGVSTMVKSTEVETYLKDGWHFGHDTDHQKEDKKIWYNDGVKSYCIKQGDPVPGGLMPGMAQKRPGGFSKFEYKWYTNGVEQKRLSLIKGDTIPEGWWPGQAD